jgi:hypothetical protein
MIGDDEVDEVERQSVVNSKDSKPGVSNYVRICSIH